MEGNLVIQLFVLAFFLSLNNFLVSLGMGLTRIWGRKRLKISFIFGFLDFSMPLVGLGIGKLMEGVIGSIASLLGIFILALLGLFLIFQGLKRKGEVGESQQALERTLASAPAIFFLGFWMSIDNLFVGFSLGLLNISVWLTVGIFGLVTFAMTLVGVTIGKVMREKAQERIKDIAGKGRILTGVIFIMVAVWKLFEITM